MESFEKYPLPGPRRVPRDGGQRHAAPAWPQEYDLEPVVWWDNPGYLPRIAMQVITRWIDDRCATMSAAIAFYALFSMAPMLLIVIAIGGYFLGPDAITGELYGQLRAVVGPDAASAIQAMVGKAATSRASTGATWLSAIIIAVGASATFTELKTSLNAIFRAHTDPAKLPSVNPFLLSTWSFVKARVLSFALVTGVGFLLIISLVADAALTVVQTGLLGGTGLDVATHQYVGRALSVFWMMLMFTLLLKWLPDARLRWRDTLAGGACASILFVLGKGLFGLYLTQLGTQDVFGAAGGFAVVLMWLFYSAAIFLLGAEVAALLGEENAARSAAAAAGTSQAERRTTMVL